jgi:hypothetical protein
MGAWLEAYEKLSEDQKDRVQRWIHLNKFIAHTLHLSWDDWVNRFLSPSMERPMDYSFMESTLVGFRGLDVEGQGVSFTKEIDPSTRLVRRVPLRAKNNLGRLSPELQDGVATLLERAEDPEGEDPPLRVPPGDVAHLQKIFPGEKLLAKLKRPDFRKVTFAREVDEIVLAVEGGGELMRMNVLEFSGVMSKALV